MGIILEDRNTKEIIFYLKGAEDVMIPRVISQYRHRIIEECDNLAREGLRTLVISKKILDPEEFNKWN